MSLVQTIREKAKLSAVDVATRAKISPSKLSKIEHGKLKLKVDEVARLARALGCQPSELIPVLDDETDPAALTPVVTAEEGTP